MLQLLNHKEVVVMKLFGMLLAVGLFVVGAVVYAERARAGAQVEDKEIVEFCIPRAYGGSRRCY